MNTKMTYLYRDASNYKNYMVVVLQGEITDEQIRVIERSLDDGEYFIPEQVGLPRNTFEDWPTLDDHAFCELCPQTSFEPTMLSPTTDMSVEELARRFGEVISVGWNVMKYMPEI